MSRFRRFIHEVSPLVAFGIGLIAVRGTQPAASYKAIELGGSALAVGVVGGAFSALALLAAIPVGMGVDRRGGRAYFLGGVVLVGVAPLIEMSAGNLLVLVAGQALLGLGQVSFSISMQTIAANEEPPPGRDERFARLAIAAAIGQLVGPAITGFAIGSSVSGQQRESGIAVAYWFAFALAGLALVVGSFSVRSTRSRELAISQVRGRIQPRLLLRRPGVPAALLTSLAVVTTVDLLVAYLPLLGDERGVAPSLIGLFLSVRAGSGLVARLALPSMLRRFGRTRVLFSTLLLAGVGMAAVIAVATAWGVIAVMCVVGFGLGAGAPMSASWMASIAPPDERGSALAVRLTTTRLGQMLIPVVLGSVALVVGSFIVFGAASLGLFLSSLMVQRSGFREE